MLMHKEKQETGKPSHIQRFLVAVKMYRYEFSFVCVFGGGGGGVS